MLGRECASPCECDPRRPVAPLLLWAEEQRAGWLRRARQWTTFLLGAAVLALGVAATIAAGVGVGSWQVFETGLVATTDASFGVVAVTESFLVLAVAWIWLRQPPGPGTVVFAATVGPLIGILIDRIPQPTLWPIVALQFGFGIVATALGIGLYIGAELGPSAQDSLFVGLFRHYRIHPGTARFTTDAVLVVAGWALGGQVGVGTVAITIALPAMVAPALRLGHRIAGTGLPGQAKRPSRRGKVGLAVPDGRATEAPVRRGRR